MVCFEEERTTTQVYNSTNKLQIFCHNLLKANAG